MTDIVERLREDAAGLRKAVSQASFASDTYVRVREPSLLIAVMDDAAEEIERLRKLPDILAAEIERLRGIPDWKIGEGKPRDVRAEIGRAHV